MQDLTGLRYFEDIESGETHQSGPYKVTREEVLAFAKMYDPQPFHLDDAAGAASLLADSPRRDGRRRRWAWISFSMVS